MLNSQDIKNVKFGKAMGGYKPEEVDLLLKKISEDYEEVEGRTKKFQDKIDQLKKEVAELADQKNSLNKMLVSAQQLADKTVEDAKNQAETILANANEEAGSIRAQQDVIRQQETEKTEAFKREREAEMREFEAQQEQRKARVIEETKTAIEEQQKLLDALKIQVTQFRQNAIELYRDGLSVLEQMPYEVSFDAKQVAETEPAPETEEPEQEPAEEEKPEEAPEAAPQPENENNGKKRSFFGKNKK